MIIIGALLFAIKFSNVRQVVVENTGLQLSGYNTLDVHYLGDNIATTSRTYLNVGGAVASKITKTENIDSLSINVWQIAASGTDAVVKIWPLHSENGFDWYRTTTTAAVLWPTGSATTASFTTSFENLGHKFTKIEFSGLGTTSAIYAEIITKQVN